MKLSSFPIGTDESKIFGICCHPFTDTAIIPDLTNKDMGNYWNLTIDDDFEKWRNYIFNKIDTKILKLLMGEKNKLMKDNSLYKLKEFPISEKVSVNVLFNLYYFYIIFVIKTLNKFECFAT